MRKAKGKEGNRRDDGSERLLRVHARTGEAQKTAEGSQVPHKLPRTYIFSGSPSAAPTGN